MTGAAVQWLRDGLQIVGSAAETAAVAATVDDTDGVVFVPALTGLGAPHWDPHARGLIIGITRGTTRAPHRPRDAGGDRLRGPRRPGDHAGASRRLRVDGGAAANDMLCQIQADQVGPAGRAAGDRRDHGAGSGLPRRARHRRVGVHRRPARDVGAGAPLRAGRRPGQGRRGARPLAATPSSGPRAGLARAEPGQLAPPRRRPRGAVSASALLGLRLSRPRRRTSSSSFSSRSPRAGRSGPAARRPRPAAAGTAPAGRSTSAPAAAAPRAPRRCSALAASPAAPGPRRRALASASGSGTTCSSGRRHRLRARAAQRRSPAPPARPARPRRRPRPPRSPRSAATSSPLRTAAAAPSSTIAAVRVASTWSATAWVTLTPSSRASARAGS